MKRSVLIVTAICVLLSVGLILGLAGCGEKKATTPATTKTTTTPATTTTTTTPSSTTTTTT